MSSSNLKPVLKSILPLVLSKWFLAITHQQINLKSLIYPQKTHCFIYAPFRLLSRLISLHCNFACRDFYGPATADTEY